MKCKSIEMEIRREQNRCFKAETFYLRHVLYKQFVHTIFSLLNMLYRKQIKMYNCKNNDDETFLESYGCHVSEDI